MTKEEFIKKYGDVKVRFFDYYKYVFTFKAMLPDGNKLICSVGGDADDIYKLEVSDEEISVRELDPNSGMVYSKDGVILGSFYDW